MSSGVHRLHISSAYAVFPSLSSWKAARVVCPSTEDKIISSVALAVRKNQKIIVNKDLSRYHLGNDAKNPKKRKLHWDSYLHF